MLPVSLRERYDAIPYRHGAVPDTNPARLGAIGRLHGVATASADSCRVLELGCAEGMNLLPLAERFPRSEFIGVDFARGHIDAAETARSECNLNNVRFICADWRDFEIEPGSFDYVIAHGVYSWVSDELKNRLLGLCGRALSPGGVAYVSYNTLPGWAMPGGLRPFLLQEAAREREPLAQIEHVRRVLSALAQSLADQPDVYPALLRQTIADMLGKPADLFYHDDLAPVNDPCTFTSFVSHAAMHGLTYLAEAHYATMPFDHVPAAMRSALAPLEPDYIREQQFMDVMFQRWMRDSLLCRAETPVKRVADTHKVKECALGLRMQLRDSRVNLAPGVVMALAGRIELEPEFVEPAEKAMLAALAQVAPARVPFAAALKGANRLLAQVGLPLVQAPEQLCGMLFRLFALDALDLALAGDGEWLRTSAAPGPSALMRYQSRQGSLVTNRWHEPVELTAEAHDWINQPSPQPNDGAMRAGLLV